MAAVPAIIIWGLFALLLTLKLTGLAAISWWAVTAPLWLTALVVLCAALGVGLFLMVAAWHNMRNG